jgi:hypothetical protein
VQDSRIYKNIELLYNRKSHRPGAPSMDQTRHWSMVDPRWRWSRGSPKHELSGFVGSESSTQEVQQGELTPGVLTGCSDGWWRGSDGPMTGRNNRWRWSSTMRRLEHRWSELQNQMGAGNDG